MKSRLKAGDFMTDAALEEELRRCYSKLRSTWERAVESALLDSIVERGKRPVQTQKLKKLIDYLIRMFVSLTRIWESVRVSRRPTTIRFPHRIRRQRLMSSRLI